jgi:uncharacterized protein
VSRPPIERSVAGIPRITLFKPAGVPARELDRLKLAVDELEAIRLVDLEGLSHERAAEALGVSRQTVGRVLERGRAKVADALVGGKAIEISGGQYRVEPQQLRCFACQEEWPMRDMGPDAASCPRCGSDEVAVCRGPRSRCGRPGGAPGRGRDHGTHGPGCGGAEAWSAGTKNR